jgi:hypothetical protein
MYFTIMGQKNKISRRKDSQIRTIDNLGMPGMNQSLIKKLKGLPMGTLFVPPVGPATPVVDNPNVVSNAFRTPWAIFLATCGLTAPYFLI